MKNLNKIQITSSSAGTASLKNDNDSTNVTEIDTTSVTNSSSKEQRRASIGVSDLLAAHKIPFASNDKNDNHSKYSKKQKKTKKKHKHKRKSRRTSLSHKKLLAAKLNDISSSGFSFSPKNSRSRSARSVSHSKDLDKSETDDDDDVSLSDLSQNSFISQTGSEVSFGDYHGRPLASVNVVDEWFHKEKSKRRKALRKAKPRSHTTPGSTFSVSDDEPNPPGSAAHIVSVRQKIEMGCHPPSANTNPAASQKCCVIL